MSMTLTGSDLTAILVEQLSKITVFVSTESSVLKYDLAVFIPEDIRIPWKKKAILMCPHRYGKVRCGLMVDALKDEADMPLDEYHEYREKVYAEGGKYSDLKRYILGDQGWHHLGDLLDEFSEQLICEPSDCPTYLRILGDRQAEFDKGLFLPGLHLFEAKSDTDNHSRLVHQLPQMYGLADYVWLVLGEKQWVPSWLPPFVGVLRYEGSKSFRLEKSGKQIDHYPAMHMAVLEDHGISKDLKPWMVKDLLRKWCINSMFRWKIGQCPLDMTEDVKRLATIKKYFRGKIDDC